MSLVATRHRREVSPSNSLPVTRDTAPELFCRAHGCPMRWSVSVNMACSYHAWEDVSEWPRITEDLRRVGPWKLITSNGDSPTVRDMKTRFKGRLAATIPGEYA